MPMFLSFVGVSIDADEWYVVFGCSMLIVCSVDVELHVFCLRLAWSPSRNNLTICPYDEGWMSEGLEDRSDPFPVYEVAEGTPPLHLPAKIWHTIVATLSSGMCVIEECRTWESLCSMIVHTPVLLSVGRCV